MWKHLSEKAKQKWAVEKPKLDNARHLRGIFFIEPNDDEFKLTMKAAQQCPYKIPIKSSGEIHRSLGKRKTTYACVLDADGSTRPRLEIAVHKHHQDHVTEKGTKSMNHYSFVHKFIPMPQAIKKMQSQHWKNWKNWKNPAWQLTKSETRKM